MKRRVLIAIYSSIIWLAMGQSSAAQCPEVYDFYGAVTDEPYWYSCSGNDYTLNVQTPNSWGAYTIDWGDGSPVESGASWTPPAYLQHAYTSAVDTFLVVITETGSGCQVNGVLVMEEATSASIQIPVGGLTQACAPQVMEFINSSTNVSETTIFTWDFGDGSPQEVYDYTNWQQTISHLYDVGTVDCETVVTLWAENYCNIVQGGPSQATFNPIRIWDLDDPSISASATLLCYPDTVVTFMNTTEMNCYFQGNIYQRYEYWNFGDYWNLGYDSIVDWTPWPPTFPHTIAFPGIGTYSIEMADSNFCGIVNTAITIEIVPPPIADIDISDDTVCVGTPITFFQQATGDANVYKWNFNNGMGWISTGTGNLTFTYNTPGTYYVQSMVAVSGASSSCSDTTGVTVVVLPNPTVNIIPDITEACDQLDVNFTQVSSGATQWNWTFEGTPSSWDGPSPPVISFNTPGQYDITLTVVGSNGCPGNDTEQVTVHASPQAAILVNNLCEGDSAHFFDASTSELYSPITSWDWNFGDGETSDETNPVHFYDNTGFYDITLVVGNGLCSDSVTQTVEVVPAPVADIGLDNATGCSPLEVQYSNNTTGAVSYLWNFGDGSSSSDVAPNHVYYNNDGIDTTYIVSFVATNSMGCASYDTLLVAPLPNAVAAYSDNTSVPGCSPYEAVFDNNSTGASTYLWTFGNGASSTLENPVYLYFNNTPFVQYFDVTLYAYATNGCHDTTSHTVTVFPLPIFDFDISPSSGCAPLNVTMPFLSGAVNYFWDFGDGTTSSLPAPTHQYQNNTLFPVIYDVTLTATSPFGCTGTSTSEVIVNPAPMAQFGISQLSGCSPLQVNLTNLSISADYYDWDYGDGSSSSEISLIHSHTFVNNGSNVQVFDITLTAHTNDGCAHIFTQSVEVWPAASASFVVPAPQCAPATLYFDNTSSNAVAYDWDFGNGLQSTAENPSSYYINSTDAPVQFDVTLSVVSSYGCTAMVTQQVTLWDTPDVDFLLSDPALCSPAPVELINLSTNADAYVWNYGDSQTSNTADSVHVHLFQQYMSGVTNYTISLTATTAQGCSATTTAPFTLYPEVEAQFMVDTTGCSPHNAAFINQSEGAISYEWNFGDGQQSSAVNPMNIYTTSSIVDTSFYSSLVATNTYGCTDTALATIHVFHAPLAIAQVDSSSGCHPLDVFFANNSIGADSYVWNYGNGLTSTVADSIHLHTFYNATPSVYTYNVTLQAYTVNGCMSTDQVLVEVPADMEASFELEGEGCTPLTLIADNTSEGAFSYFWQFGDGDISNEYEPSHTFFNWTQSDTTYTITLIVQNTFGCTDTATSTVTVFPVPIAQFSATPGVQTWPDATIDIDNTTVGGSLNYEWDMDDGTTITVENPGSYTFSTWGEYTIELFVTNGSCSSTYSQTVEVLAPQPVANFTGPASGCVPLTVTFTNLSEYAAGYLWQFGDGGSANSSTPVYTYWQPGTYTVSLTAYGFDGSQDQMVQEYIIEVYPTAFAAFTVTPSEVNVPGQPVYCLNLSQQADTFFWEFGDGGTSNLESPIYFYQQPGTYSVTLIANNEYNCPDTMTVLDAVHAIAIGQLDFPNAFTPNNSGPGSGIYDPHSFDNDVFFPLHLGVEEYELQIFNKWGELLFESDDVWRGWDGYYRGALCKQDVYVWKAKARFVDGQSIVKTGDVTLLVR